MQESSRAEESTAVEWRDGSETEDEGRREERRGSKAP